MVITSAASFQPSRALSQQPPQTGQQEEQPPQDGFLKDYIDDVKENFEQNGAISVLFGAAFEGFVGGVLGSIAGGLLSGFFPGPVAGVISTAAPALGASVGFLDGLRR